MLFARTGPVPEYRLDPVAGVKRERPAELETIAPTATNFNFAAPPKTLSLPPVPQGLIAKISIDLSTDLNKPDSILNLPSIKPAPPPPIQTTGSPQASTSAVTLDHPAPEPAQEGPKKKAKKAAEGEKGVDGGADKAGKGGKQGGAKPARQRTRASRANNQGSSQTESLWPPELDEQLIKGMQVFCSRSRDLS